jgi:O-antigen ligase
MSHSSVMLGAASAHGSQLHFEAGPKFSLLFLSGLLAAAIPLILSLYWFAYPQAPDFVGPLLRISILGCSIALGLFWYRAPLSHAEILLFRVLAAAAIVWLIPTLLATDPGHALGGWVRLTVLFMVCCFVARGLRHPPTAHAFGVALLIGAVILVAFILFTYVKYLGFTPPTYKVSREFKGVAQLNGIALNSIAFAAVFSYFMGLCLVRSNLRLLLLGVPLLVTSSFFSGSRAPMVILAASSFVLLCVNGLRSKASWRRIATILLAVSAVIGGIVVVAMASDDDLNRATEGRSHLWSVGLQKFVERPLFGYGYESWRDDLVSRLPGERALTFDLASRFGGGYHNEYIAVLAEEGLIGTFGAALIVWLLLRSSWLLAFRPWATRVHAEQWPLFAATFLLLRSNFEVPGLFGYAHDPVDYLAYLFVAIVLSRFSVEEDYARLLAQSGDRSRS